MAQRFRAQRAAHNDSRHAERRHPSASGGQSLTFETDCWDVHETLSREPDFVLIDVRSPQVYARGHVPGAVNVPHAKIIGSRMAQYPSGTLFVVYCAGPHCNGAQRGAIRLDRLGLPVKLMIGGMSGWLDEGFAIEHGEATIAAASG
jgi:rhodanese-related sulfurtransferase